MAIKRLTISLPEDLVESVRGAVGDGSMSAYVADLIREHLRDDDLDTLWRAFVDDVGLSADDVAAADRILDELTGHRTSGVA
jgi:Arc/MetJ-type ribon-helix-helix transcriptional regulator